MSLSLSRSTLHYQLIHTLIEQGRAPTSAELAEIFQVDLATITHALLDLQEDHGVVLHPHQPEAWVVHPFSTAPTPFAVWKGDQVWWGNCAWCSLGVAALLGGDNIRIYSSFGAEGTPVTLEIQQHQVKGDAVVHFPIPMAKAWDNVIYTCTTMLLFEDEAAVDAWSARHAIPKGDVQPVQHVYDFAQVWYGRHHDQNWQKWTTEQAREIFERFGLSSPIWALPQTQERF